MGMSKYGETFDVSTYERLKGASVVVPGRLKAPVRIYCDVDGVVKPFFQDDLHQYEKLETFDVRNYVTPPEGSVHIGMTPLWYDKEVTDVLAQLSRRSDVDLVWLTAWKFNAPYTLDKALGVKSSGWVDWWEVWDEYTGSYISPLRAKNGKEAAIRRLHKTDKPEAFAWVEDEANRHARFEGEFLNVQTDSYTGLTLPEAEFLTEWVDHVSKG